MGVATRGVKFKFTTGEKVLCYEPDPTKAKVLYESKVLDLVVNRDERGRKVPEYRIHFYGWNSSWDRFVREEFILPYTEENRELQTKLAEDAALTIKGRRKFKLPPLIKETLNKKQCMESASEKPPQPEKVDSSSDGAPSEDESDREVHINLPETLKRQLEKDQNLVTKNNKLVQLPCDPNVISILEAFVKYLAAKLLCASPPRNSKNGKQLMPEDVKNKLNLCKEAVDGIRVYFDFTLPYLLLYRQEMKQLQQQVFYAEIAARTPICIPVREPERREASHIKDEFGARNSAPDAPSPSSNELFAKAEPYVPRVGRPPRGRPCLKNKVGRRPNKMKNGSNAKSKVLLRAEKRALREMLKATSTRVLRSSNKQKQPKEEPDVKPSTSSGPEQKEPAVSMETRGTRKSQPQPLNSPRLSCGGVEKSFLGVSELSASTSNCITSSNSSGHSTLSDSKLDQQYHLINNAALLQDILNWHLMPPHLCKQVAPSHVYGAQHLLRLLVKLPELISKMNISSHKLQPLISIVEQFMFYLAEKKDQLFLSSAYIDSCDAVSVGNSTTV